MLGCSPNTRPSKNSATDPCVVGNKREHRTRVCLAQPGIFVPSAVIAKHGETMRTKTDKHPPAAANAPAQAHQFPAIAKKATGNAAGLPADIRPAKR